MWRLSLRKKSCLKGNEMEGRGAVKPAKHFNPESDAAILYGNLRGLANEASATHIINILSQRTNAQRVEISLSYHEIYDRDLIQDVKSGGSGDFQQAIVCMLLQPAEYDAVSLHKAMKGLKVDGKVLTEIALTRTKHEIQAIKKSYHAKYHKDLLTDIAEHFTGDFKKMLQKLFSESRDGSKTSVSDDIARKDAGILKNLQTDHVDADVILDIFCKRSIRQLGASLTCYRKLSPVCDVKKEISAHFHGDFKETIKSVLKLTDSRYSFFAEKLFHSMKGVGTDDDTLRRIIVTRSEIDLINIKEYFKQKYGKSLVKYIEGDTSGSYKKLLVAIVGK